MKMQDIKVLLVLPLYGGSLPVGQYCGQALSEMGVSVRVFAAQNLYSAYTGIKALDLAPSRINILINSFLKFVSNSVLLMAEEQKPDLVLALAQAPLDKGALLKLRKMNIPTVMWFVEDYRLFNYWSIMAPYYDAFAVIQKEPFLDELKKIGQNHAFYLPLAALPKFHKPMSLTAKERQEYGSDLSFMGAGYPNRHLAFRRLSDRDFKIWGTEWENDEVLKKNLQRGGERVSAEDTVKIYNASKINLNLHSSVNTESLISNGDFVNPRTFELASIGAFQLVDKRSLMGELFRPDELATFDTMEEFYAKIDYFLEHVEERRAYAEKAQQRVLSDHTYEQRMKSLLEYMDLNFGPLAKREDDQGENGLALSPELRHELVEICKKLQLPMDASFEDVIGRLRQQSGKLSTVETALLFLDEWRNQYR